VVATDESAATEERYGGLNLLEDHGSLVAERLDLDRAVQLLPADQRAAVVLRDLLDFDYCTIAEVLGVPAGTVRSRIARGRVALAGIMRAGNQSPAGGRQNEGGTPADSNDHEGVARRPASTHSAPNRDERAARHLVDEHREEADKANAVVTLDTLYTQMKQGKVKELNLLMKADVQGSLDALHQVLLQERVGPPETVVAGREQDLRTRQRGHRVARVHPERGDQRLQHLAADVLSDRRSGVRRETQLRGDGAQALVP